MKLRGVGRRTPPRASRGSLLGRGWASDGPIRWPRACPLGKHRPPTPARLLRLRPPAHVLSAPCRVPPAAPTAQRRLRTLGRPACCYSTFSDDARSGPARKPHPLTGPAHSASLGLITVYLLQDADLGPEFHQLFDPLIAQFHALEHKPLPKGRNPNTENRAWLTVRCTGLNHVSLEIQHTQNLRMSPYLEQGSLWM